MQGSDEAELVDFRRDVIFDKNVYSCYNEEFRKYLRENDIDELYFCGVNTGCCVLHSAFDSYNDLVSTYVIEDLCGSTNGVSSHNCAIQILSECITRNRIINETWVSIQEGYENIK
jgi:nicotinamidase-related amidase